MVVPLNPGMQKSQFRAAEIVGNCGLAGVEKQGIVGQTLYGGNP